MFTEMTMRFFYLPLLAAALVGLSGCASRTTVDYDRAAMPKFASYKCFVIDSRETRTNYQDVVLSPIVDRRIERAIGTELITKGFTQNCSNPDFRVTFNTATKTKTEVNDLGIGPTPFRRYPYMGYGGYSRIDIDQYEEGTFVVDIIDNTSKELIWRGAYSKRLGWSAPTDAEVQTIINEILAQFPPGRAQSK
jgi:hypothetical protein